MSVAAMVPIAFVCGHSCSTIVIQTHVKRDEESWPEEVKNQCVTLGMKEEKGSRVQSGSNEEQEGGNASPVQKACQLLWVEYCRPLAITDPCLHIVNPHSDP